ncbi:uncharacterized protein J3D65DRAFT_671785 [Phyllosticta citribraziliensis]|uniref:Uncharacterized protein n=1 Tax=Phyllosticta citribraziliensis TaxID=989973 RepID=A0ABR1L6J6_9PEZI
MRYILYLVAGATVLAASPVFATAAPNPIPNALPSTLRTRARQAAASTPTAAAATPAATGATCFDDGDCILSERMGRE